MAEKTPQDRINDMEQTRVKNAGTDIKRLDGNKGSTPPPKK